MEIIITGGTILTIIIGVIGFFLKRTISTLDEHDTKINNELVHKDGYEKEIVDVKKNVKEIRDNYTPMKTHKADFDECRTDIKQIKDNYLTKDDYFREQAKTDRKLDRIMDILLEMKGEK